MSEALTLARPYARAAYSLARDAGTVPAWSHALTVAASIAGDASVAAVLRDPRLARADAVSLLAVDDIEPSARDFLALLAQNRRLELLPEIAALFDRLRAEAEQIVRATVTSAAALPAGELDALTAALRRRFGREVEVRTAVDESLIGGAVIDTGDLVIDGSLKGKLSRLQSALAQ